MIQTFKFRTETVKKTYSHTVYSVEVKTAIDKWIGQIEDLQNEVYSFNSGQVLKIKQHYLNGQLKIHLDKEPYSLIYQDDDKDQVVNIERVNKGEPDFIAKITYLTTEQGGRWVYAASGYRPHVRFDGRKELTSGEQLFIDRDKVFPGETVTAEIRIIGTDFFKSYLFAGQHFEIGEGSRLIGRGEIIEVTNPNLRQACR